MKDLVRYIKNIVSKKNETPEEESPVEEQEFAINDEFPSGELKMRWDAASGDFIVSFSIDDFEDASSDTLSLLLYFLERGDLNSYILQSLKYASQEIDESFYHSVLLKWGAMVESEKKTQERAIVEPSEVFNFVSTEN